MRGRVQDLFIPNKFFDFTDTAFRTLVIFFLNCTHLSQAKLSTVKLVVMILVDYSVAAVASVCGCFEEYFFPFLTFPSGVVSYVDRRFFSSCTAVNISSSIIASTPLLI